MATYKQNHKPSIGNSFNFSSRGHIAESHKIATAQSPSSIKGQNSEVKECINSNCYKNPMNHKIRTGTSLIYIDHRQSHWNSRWAGDSTRDKSCHTLFEIPRYRLSIETCFEHKQQFLNLNEPYRIKS